MNFLKIPFSKTYTLLFLVKSLILINLTFAKLKYQYDACDPRWANDSLWLNYVLKTNGTICQDKEIQYKKYPEGFVTLVAMAFANKNYSCGEGRLCDPGVLNRDLIRCYFQINNPENEIKKKTLFQCIGLKFLNHTIKFTEIEDEVLTGFTLIAAHLLPNHTISNNRFLIEDTYDRYVRGIDYGGRSVMYPWEEIKGIEKFKILNLHKERKKNKKKNAKGCEINSGESNGNKEEVNNGKNYENAEADNSIFENIQQDMSRSDSNDGDEGVIRNQNNLDKNNISEINMNKIDNSAMKVSKNSATFEEVRKENVREQSDL
jgi:hypothetical protein